MVHAWKQTNVVFVVAMTLQMVLVTVTATFLTSAEFVAVRASLKALATVTATFLTSVAFVVVTTIADGACACNLTSDGVCGGEGMHDGAV